MMGYARCRAEGFSPERFTTALTEGRIRLTDVRRTGPVLMEFTVSAAALPRVRRQAEEMGYRLEVTRCGGLAWTMGRLWQRKALLIGILGALLLLAGISERILLIEVQAPPEWDEAEILNVVAGYGIAPGLRRADADRNGAAEAVLTAFPEAAWCGVEIYGVKATVRLKPMTPGPDEVIDWNEPSDLFAAADGIVTRIEAAAGRAMVKVGDRVRKGQLLVDGEGKAAVARIWADVWETRCGAALTRRTEIVPTGQELSERELLIGETVVTGKHEEIPFVHYEKTITEKRLGPLVWRMTEVREIVYTERPVEEETAKKLALDRALSGVDPKTLKEYRALYGKTDDMMTAEVFLCREIEIGQKKKR